MPLSLPIEPEATKLLHDSPLALLLGMLLDQQIPMEKAFSSPYVLQQRLGHDLDAAEIAAYDPDAFEEIFARPPALHRFPGSMAQRTQQLCQAIVDEWGGDAATIWTGAESGADLVKRIGSLPGFGEQKAKIFAALLAQQFGVTPPGWQEATGDYGQPGHRSIADVVDDESRVKVREYKKAKKAALKA